MSSESVRFVETWFEEVWRKGDLNTVDRMMTERAAMHGLGADADVVGPAEFKPFVVALRTAFPDIEVRIQQTIEQGDLIATRWVAHMTHEGDFAGVAPTHKHLSITGMSIARLENGKMVEGWNDWDRLSLMEQIGAVQATPTAVSTQNA